MSENLSEDACSFVCHCGDFPYCVCDVGSSVSALPTAVLDQVSGQLPPGQLPPDKYPPDNCNVSC